MNLRLIVPALLDFSAQHPLPAGLQTLRRATRLELPGASLEQWLCRFFGLDGCPVAALTSLIDAPGQQAAAWLRADPVHLALAQNSVGVVQGDVLDLHPDEADELGAAVAPLLDDVGAQLLHNHAQRWYLQLAHPQDCRFMALPDAIGRPLPPTTMEGADAARWKRLSAEIQMTLHQHPVNEKREQRGLPPINHIWLWGEGQLGQGQAPAASLRGDHLLLRALAQHTGQPLQSAPSTFARWQRETLQGDAVVLLDSLLDCARAGDAGGWHNAREALVEDWLTPALHAGLQQLDIIVPAPARTIVLRLGRWNRWQFWKNTDVSA